MKKKLLHVLITIAAYLPLTLPAQKNVRIVVDGQTRAPVDYVFVTSDDGKLKQLSTKEGRFVLFTDTKVKAFNFYKMGYQKLTVKAANLLMEDTIFLTQRPFQLKEVEVSNEKLTAVVKDKRYYVDDYLALANGDFLLLISRINVKGFEVSYFNRDRGITRTQKIRNEEAPRLVTDCFKNVHLVTDRFSRQVFFDSDSTFEFLPKYNRPKFDSTLANCVLKLDTQLIMKQLVPSFRMPILDFYAVINSPFLLYYTASPHTQRLFYTVVYNAQAREMLDNEVKDFYLMGLASGGGGIGPREENKMILFYNTVGAPLYAPVFLKNDTIVIFNFQREEIVFLNPAGSIYKQVKMDHGQFATLHRFEIIYDEPVQKFYVKFKEFDKATINRINVYTGKIEQKVKLEKVFARNIQILNDHIYYLVREKEWDDTQYLYLQN